MESGTVMLVSSIQKPIFAFVKIAWGSDIPGKKGYRTLTKFNSMAKSRVAVGDGEGVFFVIWLWGTVMGFTSWPQSPDSLVPFMGLHSGPKNSLPCLLPKRDARHRVRRLLPASQNLNLSWWEMFACIAFYLAFI